MLVSALVFSIALAQRDHPKSLSASMRAANASYNAAEPYPIESAGFSLIDAAEGYRDVLKRFGHIPAARAGLAKCNFCQGDYLASSKQFALLGSSFSREATESKQRLLRARSVNKLLHGTRVLQILPIPAASRWVALVGGTAPEFDWKDNQFAGVSLLLVQFDSNRVATILDRRLLGQVKNPGSSIAYEDSAGSAYLYLTKTSVEAKRWSAVVYRNFPAADCSPGSIETCEISKPGFQKSFAFGSLADLGFRPATKRHGLVIVAAPTFKVWWPDTYEWRGDRFFYANKLHPELYSKERYGWSDDECDHYYPFWMTRAAILSIQSKPIGAFAAWKRAEKACLKTLKYGHNGNYSYHDSGFCGEPRINLHEIRQRIQWLRRHDLNHPLLYRPYDFDVEAPPYRLGPAHGPS